MRVILALIAKDLARKRAAPWFTVVMLAFPVVLSLIIGFAFGAGPSKDKGKGLTLPPIEVALVDEDRSFVSRFISGAGGERAGGLDMEFRPVERPEGEAMLAKGSVSALLRIPAGFGDRFMSDRPDTLFIRQNPAESVKPAIATEYVKVTALFLGTAGRVFAGPLAEIANATGGEHDSVGEHGGGESPDVMAGSIASTISHIVRNAAGYIAPPLITLDASAPAKTGETQQGAMFIALFLLPGISVMSIMMIGQGAMSELLRERSMGTLRRTFAAPVGVAQILGAKLASVSLLAVISFIVLALVAIVWGAPHVDAAGFVVLAASFVLAVVGMTALVYGLARNERQGSTIAMIIILSMSFVGGSWIPLDSLPHAVRHLSPLTLNFWAVDGFSRLLFDHAGSGALARNALVLLAIGLVGIAGGSGLLRRRLMEGA